jgi:pantoate--beta-alanine ligase
MRAWAAEARQTARIGLVPTMGALHAGHLSLMRLAREKADRLVVSIFVNPLQFGPKEDFALYPRDFDRDAEMCRSAGADAIFHPSVEEMYQGGHSVYVDENNLANGLCGAARPGHFRGVLTVVAKLLNVVRPDVAVFGQKDAQQVRLIEQMASDLSYGVDIVVAPTLREPDGLAMSSRNMYLAPDERARAACLSQALRSAVQLVQEGQREAAFLKAAVRAVIEAAGPGEVEYVEIVAWDTLQPVAQVAHKCLVAVAVRFGRARLIDNAFLL